MSDRIIASSENGPQRDDPKPPRTEHVTLGFVGTDEPDRPVVQRIRQLLKIAKRGLRLRCVSATAADGTAVPHAD